jgi:hypothetical protein
MSVNFEEDSSEFSGQTSATALERVMRLVDRMQRLNADLADLENKTKSKSEELQNVTQNLLPLAMDEANLADLRLSTGQRLKLTKFVQCSIPKGAEDSSFNWLRENGHGDLIKRNVTAAFGMGQDEIAARVAKELNDQGLQVTDKSSVHPATLKSFAKEQIENGVTLPTDLFPTYVGRKAVIANK